MALAGIRVIELAGLAPSPFAGAVLADFGAKVIRVERLKLLGRNLRVPGLFAREKRSIELNLKTPGGVRVLRKLCRNADVLIEPFRPGVMEKMGAGPRVLMADNPQLIYLRMTGYGQSGPFKDVAGHDINYIALSGVLSHFGRQGENPTPPVNIMADFAGGSLLAVLGITMALYERERSGQGQVIDSSMSEGSAYVSSFLWATRHIFVGIHGRGTSMLDTGAHFYDTYKTSDGKYMAVGALEPQFYTNLLKGLGLQESDLPPQLSAEDWPSSKKIFAEIFSRKTREEWCRVFHGIDACVTPVLTGEEAPDHEHNKERGSFLATPGGLQQPAPAPRLSRTPAVAGFREQTTVGGDTENVLLEIGYSHEEIRQLGMDGTVREMQTENAKL